MSYTKPENISEKLWSKMDDEDKAELCGLKIKKTKQLLVPYKELSSGKFEMTDANHFIKYLRKVGSLNLFVESTMKNSPFNRFNPDSEHLKLSGQSAQTYDKAKQQVVRDDIYRVFARENPKFRCTCKYQRSCKDGKAGDRCWRLIDTPFGVCNTHKNQAKSKLVVSQQEFCEMYAKQKPIAFKLMIESGKYTKFKHLNTIGTKQSILKTQAKPEPEPEPDSDPDTDSDDYDSDDE